MLVLERALMSLLFNIRMQMLKTLRDSGEDVKNTV